MAIEPIFENRFAKYSYGFRPGCGCMDALRRVEELLRAGNTQVVDVDIEGFLKQGVIEGQDWQEAKGEGTPQGGVISPLLANIYLDPLDWLMAGLGFEMVRYADDMVVLCRSQEEAGAALEKLGEWMAEAGLTLHPEKKPHGGHGPCRQSFRLPRLSVQTKPTGASDQVGAAQKPAQTARIHQTPDPPQQRQEHGGHRGGHQPDAERLVRLLQTRSPQRTR